MGDLLATAYIDSKLDCLESAVHSALLGFQSEIPQQPARDIEIVSNYKNMPTKKGIGSIEGRARLLHDMANIELQAMEMAYRGLIEYPDAPKQFREELADLVISEGQHLRLCLEAIRELGYNWGSWPAHLGLWTVLSSKDDLLDRILIVHRYLEGSGLDAGYRLLQRLDGLPQKDITHFVIQRIHQDEISHVNFGSQWYRSICGLYGLDAEHDFKLRMSKLSKILPYRSEPIAKEVRINAGFTEQEIIDLELWRYLKRQEDRTV